MLYTFSRADYSSVELQTYFTQISKDDAIVLWQDGVFLALKYPHYFDSSPAFCAMLEIDISARNLTALLPQLTKIRQISLLDFVEITERQQNQIAL
ncbi:DsrH/TusB family sulfur relay protein [Rodentibacter caecimuris]|uniref:Sulfurtransferase TusB n=1 Tax=Rodentibacter caecimuris TaxID=1796644 RepID=A0ABX3KZH0_9PAST|nr:hypothetical protein BKG89_08570 [Rodentibacter heylii]